MRILLIFLLLFLVNFNFAFAEEKQKTMSRADVIEKLSTSDFLKKKIGDLFNWSVGYDKTKINRTNLAPTISFIKAAPIKVPPDDRTVVLITAKVSDPSGPDNIRGVRADLSSIKKLPNTMLVDNGLWGDVVAGDGIYTLQTSVGYDSTKGIKDIPVAVSNKMGWVALSRTNLDVEIDPIISETKAIPPSVPADGKTAVTLTAKVENPGRQEDLKDVNVDLSSIGMESSVQMWDDGTHGDALAGNKVYSVLVTVKDGVSKGLKKLDVHATNVSGGSSSGEILLVVQ